MPVPNFSFQPGSSSQADGCWLGSSEGINDKLGLILGRTLGLSLIKLGRFDSEGIIDGESDGVCDGATS